MIRLALLLLSLTAAARAEDETVLPEGAGREAVFALCTACHDTALIRRTRLDRARWDGLMDWMTERHGMTPLDGALRVTVVDYLADKFGPGAGPGRAGMRARNPFTP